jgi:hypothetical protein
MNICRQQSYHCVPGNISPRMKCSRREANNSLPTSGEFKNAWSNASISPQNFMAQYLRKHMTELPLWTTVVTVSSIVRNTAGLWSVSITCRDAPLVHVASYWSPLTVRWNTKRFRPQAWCSSLEWTDPRGNLHISSLLSGVRCSHLSVNVFGFQDGAEFHIYIHIFGMHRTFKIFCHTLYTF